MELREIIRDKRNDKGLSADELAKKVGVHYSTIYDIETGKGRKTVRRSIMEHILNILEIDVNSLNIDIEPYVNDYKMPVTNPVCQICNSQENVKEIVVSKDDDLKLVLCKSHRKKLANKLITSL